MYHVPLDFQYIYNMEGAMKEVKIGMERNEVRFLEDGRE